MRYLIISDLHGNYEALQAALAAAEGRYEKVICCGDLVGYGPDPNPTVDWVRANAAAVVRGNHDKACCGITNAEDFNAIARHAAFWTRDHLSADNLAYLRALPSGPIDIGPFVIVHGSVDDEDEYVFVNHDATFAFRSVTHSLTFFGHTHVQGGFYRIAEGPARVLHPELAGDETTSFLEMREREQYMINPGSVGQPRDADPRAAFAIMDTEPGLGVIEFWRVPYDLARTQQKMIDEGLPAPLAYRLSIGR